MKKIFVAVSAIGLLLASCTSVEQYKLTGKVAGVTKGKVYLSQYLDNKMVKTDSTDMTESGFTFEGSVASPDLYFISFEGKRGNIQVFLENTNITVDADVEKLQEAKVTGSANQEVLNAFSESQKTFLEHQKRMYQEYQKASQEKNIAAVDSIKNAFDKLEETKLVQAKEFVKANANAEAAGFVAYRITSTLDEAGVEEVYELLGEKPRNTTFAALIKKKIDIAKKVAIGQPAPDFKLNTPEGTPLALSSLKGKVVVIDFWASWCGPCRKENPHMVELYKELSPKGVEFLGVSLDEKKEAWLKAIEDDQLIWKHVSDLKGWNSEAAKMYGITGIPATVVIDKDGKIAAKKVFGDELKAEIEKLIQ